MRTGCLQGQVTDGHLGPSTILYAIRLDKVFHLLMSPGHAICTCVAADSDGVQRSSTSTVVADASVAAPSGALRVLLLVYACHMRIATNGYIPGFFSSL